MRVAAAVARRAVVAAAVAPAAGGAGVRAFHVASVATAAAEKAAAAADTSELVLNLAVPHRSLVAKMAVKRVTLPGRDGVFGVEKNSPPLLSELRPGVIRVDFNDGASEEYFVPGGFSFKHANNVMDVSCPEGVKLDQVDVDALRAANTEAGKKRDAAAGSKEAAEAKVVLELYRSLSQSLKITL